MRQILFSKRTRRDPARRQRKLDWRMPVEETSNKSRPGSGTSEDWLQDVNMLGLKLYFYWLRIILIPPVHMLHNSSGLDPTNEIRLSKLERQLRILCRLRTNRPRRLS